MKHWLRVVVAILGLTQIAGASADNLRSKLLEKIPSSKQLLLALTPEDEVRVGEQIAANLLGVAPLVNDEPLQRYVNTVGRWLASQSERPDLPWRFGVIESADVNAFAAPGGHVLITRGLYASLSDEAELAGVLAHEIAHITERHHIDLMRKTVLLEESRDAIEKQTKGNKEELLKRLVGNGAEIFARGLDKKAEFEADRHAIVLSARAGYNPYGLPAVLQKIGSVANSDDRVQLLFKTHPLPEERLRQLDSAMGSAFYQYERPNTGGRLYPLR
ncbi:MAG: M48 family metalloprotease [Gammaproteobacteria bacterium]|nr:M48 family metalloprotease [Gammaproteobacteria bacterium]